jgi:hypothetical protein
VNNSYRQDESNGCLPAAKDRTGESHLDWLFKPAIVKVVLGATGRRQNGIKRHVRRVRLGSHEAETRASRPRLASTGETRNGLGELLAPGFQKKGG